LETLFGDQKPHAQESPILFEPFILLLRLEGKCSLPSLASILKYFQYQPNSVGYLSECFQHYGGALPSTLAMAEHTVVFYLSDEIFGPRSWRRPSRLNDTRKNAWLDIDRD
jgi:hypothetical protein